MIIRASNIWNDYIRYFPHEFRPCSSMLNELETIERRFIALLYKKIEDEDDEHEDNEESKKERKETKQNKRDCTS